MSLQKSITAELQTSIKNRDSARTAAIRVLIGEFQRQPQKDLEDDQVVSIIKKLVKSERELLAVSGQTASEFIDVMENYLPVQASEEEIRAWITAHVDFSSFANKMQAMRPIMNHFGSKADGNRIKKILQEM
jgi:hypothetical protein